MTYGIERYVGCWVSSSGQRLRIRRKSRTRASVDFFDPSGAAVLRPYMSGAPTKSMEARYDDYYGDFVVDLWERDKGFTMELDYEYEYDLDKLRREALVFGISRYQEDEFLDAFYPLFGPLNHFVREEKAESGPRD